MTHVESYEPVDDWSREARTRLVATRGDEIRALLDLAFSSFVDEHPAGLSGFGFHGDDPVAEAVDWVVQRFVEIELDPSKLHPGSRSFRLFTEVRFWLCQKVGREGYARILAAASLPDSQPETISAEDEESCQNASAVAAEVEAFGRELASALRELRDRSCADIVGFWLEGTKPLRREWFGWRDRGQLSEAAFALSKKQRSFYAHDAMFRFLCCLHRFVPVPPEKTAERALETTMLSPCENEPPYRVPDRDVAALFLGHGVKGPRDVSRLRKEGARIFVERCLEFARAEFIVALRHRLSLELTRRSIGSTTLHALGIEDDVSLRERIRAIEALREEMLR